MPKRVFALTGVIALGVLAVTVATAGCSWTELITEVIHDGGTADGRPTKNPGDDEEADNLVEERTVGTPCSTSKDCVTEGSVGDNFCSSDGALKSGYLSTPVCISACKVPSLPAGGIVGSHYYCDGDVGVCVGSEGAEGVCLGKCKFTSTSIVEPCAGNNTCTGLHAVISNPSYAIGFCGPGCSEDEDCKGTSGLKCNKDTGACLPTLPEPDTKGPGQACKEPASSSEKPECSRCSVVGGTGPTKDNGFCTRLCTTVAAFDEPDAGAEGADAAAPVPDACDAWLTGWRCTAGLATKTTFNGTVYRMFTGQPPGIRGECRRPCSKTEDCADLAAATGANVECREYAGPGGKPASFCSMAP